MADRTGFALDEAHEIAKRAHAGQVDKLGVDYVNHVESVAGGLVDFDLDLQIAGMLHDVVEDSDITLADLREAGVSERALGAIELVSRNLHPSLSYLEGIERVCTSRDASLVKISDNAHNSLPERIEALGRPADPKYADARRLLYAAVPREDVERILRRANPALLAELD
ncbi:hypothetical protein [Aeromicrobium sp.]|uniref:hypothetical protein n=1 Tax=Aeromicrobium sp. TaxID=1871063 RepID=UPI003C521029